jgi:VWFA-related protein
MPGTPIECTDGLFCNGVEICVNGSCQQGSDPCPGQLCNENEDLCYGGVDSDNDCIPDSVEDSNGNGVVDPGETDPQNPDTDGDGLLDGQEDTNCNGSMDFCEKDPTVPDLIFVVQNQIDTSSYPTVFAFVTVTDEEDNPMDNLTDSNFSVTEDGIEQSPIEVAPPGVYSEPISVALALDYSLSMTGERLEDMQNAAISFINQLGPSDAAEIIKFATEVEVAQTFTTDKNALIDAISGTAWGSTALYDAIYRAVTDTAAQRSRGAVIVITDGADSASSRSLEETINHAVSSGVPVYTIGLGPAPASVLEEIAQDTGGKYYYAPTSDDLEAIYQEIAEVFQNQYSVSYQTSSTGSSICTLEVRISSAGLTGSDCKEFVIDTSRAMPWIPLLLLDD